MAKTPQNKLNKTGTVRIISGRWRGRKIPIVDRPGLRPTADRTRETLFNWLQGDIHGSRCLDCFAGTGALGLEALSRGASEVVLLEKDSMAASNLKEIIHSLSLDTTQTARCVATDTLEWLQRAQPQKPFDIVFLDPPFAASLWCETINLLSEHHLIAPEGLVYVEMPKDYQLNAPNNWQLWREKCSSQVCFRLYCC